MNNDNFHKGIEDAIKKCSYEFYVVHADLAVDCSCMKQATAQPDAACKRCLGIGKKIKIRKTEGASNNVLKGTATLGVTSSRVTKTYFILNNFLPNEKDLIIDDNEVYYVHRSERRRALGGVYTHSEIAAIKQTNKHNTVLKNFYEILNKHKKKK